MGTRNLTCVMLDGEYKVAQYGQWDGHPGGQGMTALRFVRRANLTDFAEKVRACRWITQEEWDATWNGMPDRPDERGSVSIDGAAAHRNRFPHLSRDAGADILHLIADSDDGLSLKNSLSFAGDSVFCEWAYVIDLDKRTFEVYRGFNEEPLAQDERFAGVEGLEKSSEYHPVRHAATWRLDELPTDKAFMRAFKDEDDDDDEDVSEEAEEAEDTEALALRVLRTKIEPLDVEAETIGEYLAELLVQLWIDGEGFSGKRPFGESGWKQWLYAGLIREGLIAGKLDEHGSIIDGVDTEEGDRLITLAIDELIPLATGG